MKDTERKEQLKQIRMDMNAALAAVAKKHGLSKLEARGFTYTDDAVMFKVEGLRKGGLSMEQEMYQMLRKHDSQLPPLGAVFQHKGEAHKVIGATKRRILTEGDRGKFAWRAESVKQVWLAATEDLV